MTTERSSLVSRLVFGVALVLVGVLFTLQNLDLVQLEEAWRFWPLILVAVGLSKLVDARQRNSGGWLIVIGLWCLVNTLELWGFDWVNSWPLLLIGIGVWMVLQSILAMVSRSTS